MKKITLLLPLLFILSGCATSTITPYKSDITGESVSDCSYLEPSNPYSYGSGHYAGFEWAEKKGATSCGGNSTSFIEGCEEYVSQVYDYDSCLSK